jgi:lambda family phage minor tail protein L
MADQKIVQELQQVAPSAIIELFELRLVAALHGSNDVYRFHAGVNAKNDGGNVVWAGQTYTRMPIECEGFEYSGNGQLPRPTLRIANVLGTVTTVLLAVNAITPGNDLIGAKVIRKRTLARYLDAVNFPSNVNPYGTPDPAAEFPEEIYYISRKVAETRDVVELEMAAAFDLQGVRAPKRQCIANICQWVYRSAECSYTGDAYFNDNDQAVGTLALDVCGKRVSSCKARFGATAALPFGSFPGIGSYTT